MNEKIDLTKILKGCPKGTKFYSSIYGEVEVAIVSDDYYPVWVFCPTITQGIITPLCKLSKDGKYDNKFNGECTLFPSKDQRDWSKFTAPWYKKEKFDPNTLKAFDKVLVKISNETFNTWYADFVAEPSHVKNETPLILGAKEANMVIPYNDETKHLVGTTEEAPEYYRYWEE